MFIDIQATKLLDNTGVSNILWRIHNGRLGNLDRGNDRSAIVTQMRIAFLHHHNVGSMPTDAINYMLDKHVALGVSRGNTVVPTLGGTYREKFAHHNQIHISNDLAVLSVSYRNHPKTVGLLIPNTEARNPMYFSHTNMFNFLNEHKTDGMSYDRVLTLLNKVQSILKQPVPRFRHIDAATCIEFIRGTMGLMQDNLILTIEPKTKLSVPKDVTTQLGRGNAHVLYPYVVKVYLELCKRDGNYALGTHQLWQ